MIYLFILLRLLDLLTTYIGIQLGVCEGNSLQAVFMGLGILYYPFNFLLSLLLYKFLKRFKVGEVVLKIFMGMNALIVIINLFCILLAL